MRYGPRLKTETKNAILLLRCGERFSLKKGKRYGLRLRCRGSLSPNRGNGRSRNGTVKFERTTVQKTKNDFKRGKCFGFLLHLVMAPFG